MKSPILNGLVERESLQTYVGMILVNANLIFSEMQNIIGLLAGIMGLVVIWFSIVNARKKSQILDEELDKLRAENSKK
jgi:hypothetical protein